MRPADVTAVMSADERRTIILGGWHCATGYLVRLWVGFADSSLIAGMAVGLGD